MDSGAAGLARRESRKTHRGHSDLQCLASLSGRLEIAPPAAGPLAPRPFSLGKSGERQFFDVALKAPLRWRPAVTRSAPPRCSTTEGGGARSPRARLRLHPADSDSGGGEVVISAADIRCPLRRVGYVRGAADRVPEALSAVGLPVEILTERDLRRGPLALRRDPHRQPGLRDRPGPRSGQRPALEYARAGGLLVVQYQQYPFVQGGFAPYPLEIARPHDRVTDETARVVLLDPASPVFHVPNEIGPADWEGWVQERGLYFARSWAPEYTPLLAMADPGGSELKGALLAAPLGKGRYVYTGLAFFRQLPAGVPGAYRLLANLLAWR